MTIRLLRTAPLGPMRGREVAQASAGGAAEGRRREWCMSGSPSLRSNFEPKPERGHNEPKVRALALNRGLPSRAGQFEDMQS